jgi:hypothetical protein
VKALSLSRPWTELILDGHKPIENRTWATDYRGPVIIHGALSFDPRAIEVAYELTPDFAARMSHWKGSPTNPTGFLGVVDLVFICRPTHRRSCTCGPWAFKDTHHWQLENPRRFPEPIPGPGRLGLFTPPAEVLDAAGALT